MRRHSVSGFVMAMLLWVACSDESTTTKEPEALRCPDAPVIHTGVATFYTFASGAGNCMFDSTPNDLMVTAINSIDYAGSALCGACVNVTGPRGTITVRIVDRCPECPQGNLDLSPLAFSQLADTSLGRIPIRWQLTGCQVTGPIIYHFKDGSNQWWTAVQIRNHRYPILSLEYLTPQHTYKAVNRVDYNYFVEPAGMGPGPFTFRVTDIYGHVLLDTAIVHVENGNVTGRAQFPPCSP
jgi:expansin